MAEGELQRPGVAAARLRLGAHHAEQPAQVVSHDAQRLEAVAQASGAAGRGDAVPADVEGHRAADRLGVGHRAVEVEELRYRRGPGPDRTAPDDRDAPPTRAVTCS
ncbi:UNVERIFIED_ORG: hypothetical protein FHR35_000591 [Microbispora rosea subsp. rosea]